MRWGATLLIVFQTELGVLAGPEADNCQECTSAVVISEAASCCVSLTGSNSVGGGWLISHGKSAEVGLR